MIDLNDKEKVTENKRLMSTTTTTSRWNIKERNKKLLRNYVRFLDNFSRYYRNIIYVIFGMPPFVKKSQMYYPYNKPNVGQKTKMQLTKL